MSPLSGLSARITPRPINPSIQAESREFDGTTIASVSADLEGLYADDEVMINSDEIISEGWANFIDASAGLNKYVQVTGIQLIGGEDRGNYVLLASNASTYADIFPAPMGEPAREEPLKQQEDTQVLMAQPTTQVEPEIKVTEVAPMSLQMASSATQTPVVFERRAETTQLNSVGGTIAIEQVADLPLPVYLAENTQPIALNEVVDLDVTPSNASVKPSANTADVPQSISAIDNLALLGQTQIGLTNAEGASIQVDVRVTESNLLVIDLGDNDTQLTEREVTLLGVAAMKEMGLSPKTLKGVVIKRK
jgi:hypothetical protein